MPPGLSVVVPVYGCAECLRALQARLRDVLESTGEEWEVVYVDDRSPDGSWRQLERLAAADARVRPWRMDRNRGQGTAIRAGLERSAGDWVVVMDCDLQDPPEAIPLLLARARSGSEVVFTLRPAPRGYGWARRLGTAAYLRLRDLSLRGPRVRYSSFSLLTRRAAQAVLAGDARSSYLMALQGLELPSAAVEVPRADRHAGRSSYTLTRLARFAVRDLATRYRLRARRRRPRRSEAAAGAPGPAASSVAGRAGRQR